LHSRRTSEDMKVTQLKPIEEYAKEQMTKLGLYGWPHVERVLRLCMQISKVEKEQVDRDVLEVAALLHDVAKYLEKENNALDHGDTGADMAEGFLDSIGFNEDKAESVCHAIRVHTHGEEPHSVEARILHDADLLDKTGCVGIASIFIKACLTNTTIEETAKFWRKRSKASYVARHIRWLKEPQFYTETARNLARERNQIVHAFFKQLEEEIRLKDFLRGSSQLRTGAPS